MIHIAKESYWSAYFQLRNFIWIVVPRYWNRSVKPIGLNWAAQSRRLKHVTTLQDYYYLVNCYIFVIAQTVADDQLP